MNAANPDPADIKLSIAMITYNHEKFIAQAIESALMQKIDTQYEIVIGEDCSTDNTLAICEIFAKRYPNKIRLLHRETNLGMMNNFVATLNTCRGEYIALLEGDDYWTVEDKLACQVEFLDNHKDYSICSHNVNLAIDDQVSNDEWLGVAAQTERTIEDLLSNGSGGATCSLVFRKDALLPVPDWYPKQKGGDWSLQVLCASKGRMRYLPSSMGVYRKHPHGALYHAEIDAYSRGDDTVALPTKNSLEICDALDEHFNFRYSKLINQQRAYWSWMGAMDYASVNTLKATNYIWKTLSYVSLRELHKNVAILGGLKHVFFRRWRLK